jgi:magnesium and cobalt exporter, CNNM family
MIFNILLFTFLISCSAFFSASETAIFSLTNIKIRRLSSAYKKGKTLLDLLKRPTRLLSAIVFGNLLVNIAFTSFSTAFFVNTFGKKGLVISIFLSGTVILFFGEIFPKIFAIYTAERFSLMVAPIFKVFSHIFSPLIVIIEHIVTYFSSFIIRKPSHTALSDEEFRAALLISKSDGQISEEEEEMIGSVLEFKDTQASEILIARIDIKGISNGLSNEDIIKALQDNKHSKLPVYEGSLDNITGILYAKDVFLNPDKDISEFLRKPIFIPESKKIDDILKMFLENDERMAIVLDEYGGTAGLITFEDIVEEIFGEIYDEFETPQEPVEQISKNTWKVFGKTAIKAINAELDLDLPEDKDTIAGFLLSKIERIPRVGECFSFQVKSSITSEKHNIHFCIERASARRIISMVVTIKGGINK